MCQLETIPTDPSAAEAGDAADASVGRSLDMLQMKFSIFCHLTANSKQDWHANVPQQVKDPVPLNMFPCMMPLSFDCILSD